jgi:tetratricopeptide (TPR) repeat protein
MRSGRLVTGLWVVVLVAAAAPPAMADTAPWLSPEWTVRRVVDIKMDEPRQPGGEVAACAFYTGGLAKPDSSDVRVAVGGRQLVNSRILQTGPGDLVRLAFEVLPNEKHYYVYYGNPKADAPKPWQPQRGVMLEVRRWPGGPAPQKFEQLQAAWAKAKPLGADFVSRVSLGFNPFAESDTPAIYHYTGWFVTPDPPGTYPMDISTNGASWLLVDGKERIARPGSHGPIGHSRRPVPVPLPQGVHRLDFWNANDSGPMMNLAAWQPPEAKGFEAIPAKVFLPVTQAALIETDVVGQKMAADFFAENAGETWWPDRYAVRMRLKNLTKGAAPGRIGRAEWDFGDGQTSELASPLHVYLAPGDYTVTLRQTLAATSSTFRTKVRVERNWWKQMDPAIEPIAKYADEAAQYNFQKLDVRGLTAAVSLFQHESRKEALAAAAAELALKRPEVEEAEVLRVGLLLGDALRNLGKAQEAVAAYRQLEGRAKMPTLKARAAVQIAETLLENLHRWDDAEKEYQRVLQAFATTGAEEVLRQANIGIGDIWRHRGDADKARKAYGAAAARKISAASPNEQAVRVGTLARYVEEYTRRKDWEWAFKSLEDWAWEFPKDKLEGHWSLLKATALAARGDRDAALQEAGDLLAASPASAYAVRLLMLAAECHVARGETDKARLLLQSAVEDYPEDPEQDAARKRLAALGGPLKTDTKPAPKSFLPPPPKAQPKPEPTPEPKSAPPAAPSAKKA